MLFKSKKLFLKLIWTFALFSEIVFAIVVISAGNIRGCIIAIVLGLYITYKGNPIIFEEYNIKRREHYKKAKEQRKDEI